VIVVGFDFCAEGPERFVDRGLLGAALPPILGTPFVASTTDPLRAACGLRPYARGARTEPPIPAALRHRNDPRTAQVMNDEQSQSVERSAQAFLQLIRKRFSHDLRGPLGTIVNYAALLEDERTSDFAQVRDYAGRVRQSAMRAASMLQAVSNAVGALTTPTPFEAVELASIVRDAAAQAGSPQGVVVDFVASSPEASAPLGRRAVVFFALTAFLRLARELSDDAALRVTCECSLTEREVEFRVWSSARPSALPTISELEPLLREEGRRVSAECSFALRLAADLAAATGGAFELRGRPGAAFGCVLRDARRD